MGSAPSTSRIVAMLSDPELCLQLLIEAGIASATIPCVQCEARGDQSICDMHPIASSHSRDGLAYKCQRKGCRARYTIRKHLKIRCPKNFDVLMYSRVVFDLFPTGMSGHDVERYLETNYNFLTTSETCCLLLRQLRRALSSVMQVR